MTAELFTTSMQQIYSRSHDGSTIDIIVLMSSRTVHLINSGSEERQL